MGKFIFIILFSTFISNTYPESANTVDTDLQTRNNNNKSEDIRDANKHNNKTNDINDNNSDTNGLKNNQNTENTQNIADTSKNDSNVTNIEQTNDVTEVTVYTENNYQGKSYILQPRSYLISEIEKFKSIKIPEGYEILLSDRKDYDSNNNQSYSKSVPTLDTGKFKYVYIAKLDNITSSGIATREEYNENTHEYIGVGITALKALDSNVEKITIDNSPQFTGLGNITQYKKLKFINYNATSNVSEEVFIKDMNSIFDFLDKTSYLKNIELVGEHKPLLISQNRKFLGVNIQSLSEIPENTEEIYLIDCNKISDTVALKKFTSLKKLFLYGSTFALANWQSVLSDIDTLSTSGNLTHIQLPPSFVGEIAKSKSLQTRRIEYFGALGATKIAVSGFEYCQNLKEVYFPNVKTVDTWGFHRCNNLTTVDMPKCENINQNAFYCSENLQEVKLKSVTKVGEKAFYQCKKLTTVDMPNVREIGVSAFETCASLKKFGDLSKIEKDNSFYAPKLTKVSNYAFKMTDASGQTKIETVDMPECLSIGKESFSRWRNLKKLNLPKCKTIATEGFYDPYALQEVNLPEVEIIETRAFVFNKDENLNGTLNLPKVKTIGSCAFGGSVYAHPNILAVNAPECVNMANDAFRGNSELNTITSNSSNKISVLQQSRLRL